MRKTFKNGLLLVAVAAAIFYSFQQTRKSEVAKAASPPAPPTALTTLTVSGAYSFAFDPTDIVNLSDNGVSTDATDDDDWRVFVNFGDGTFWMGQKNDFDGRTFVYNITPSKLGYAELTTTYDDDKNPGRAAMPSFTPSTAPTPLQRQVSFSNGKSVRLQSNRNPRAGHAITYIISYRNTRTEANCSSYGDIKFYYDSDVFEVEDNTSIDSYHSETHQLGSASSSSNTGLVHLKFTSLEPNEQRNLFVRLLTKPDVSTSTSMKAPRVEYRDTTKENISGCEFSLTDSDEMAYQVIVNSHDPNHKLAQEEALRRDANYVTFTVMFQNEGPFYTQKVAVYDELDPFLMPQAPQLISWSTPMPPAVSISGRKVKFDFGNLRVRGLGEPDYGITFEEESTMETFTFRCAIKKQTQLSGQPVPKTVEHSPCTAICNWAQVVFDCNPPYATNMAIAPVLCLPNPTAPPGPAAFIAPICSEQIDTLNFDSLNVDSFLLSIGQLSALLNALGDTTAFRFKWYPSENFVDPFALNPTLKNTLVNKPAAHQLVLVASRSCQRRVIYVNLPSSCQMKIQVRPNFSGGGGCSGGSVSSFTASVTGIDAAAQANLIWHDCSTGSTLTRSVNQYQNEYYFGVTDPSTGCSTELIYTYPPVGGGGGIGGPWSAQARLAVAALVILIAGFLYRIFSRR